MNDAAKGSVLNALSPDTVRDIMAMLPKSDNAAILFWYVFELTPEEQTRLEAGDDAVWLRKDSPEHRQHVADQLTTGVLAAMDLAFQETRRRTERGETHWSFSLRKDGDRWIVEDAEEAMRHHACGAPDGRAREEGA